MPWLLQIDELATLYGPSTVVWCSSSSSSNAEPGNDAARLPQYAHLLTKSMVANGTLRLPGFAVCALPRSGLVCRKVGKPSGLPPLAFFRKPAHRVFLSSPALRRFSSFGN